MDPMTGKADYQALQEELYLEDVGRGRADAIFQAHRARIEGFENYYGYGIGPGVLNIYVYPKTDKSKNQLGAFRKEVNQSLREGQPEPVKIILVEAPNEAAELAKLYPRT